MWLTVREYANKHDIAINSVHKKIKKNTIQSKKEKGMYLVWQDDTDAVQQPLEIMPEASTSNADDAYADAMRKSKELENALKQEKLKNLRQDTLLKKQKNRQVIQQYRKEFAQGVFQAFTESFGDVKKLFIELKLNKQMNEKLKSVFKKCIGKFQKNLTDYLAKSDKERQQDETET